MEFSEIAETAKSDENEVDASVVPSPEKIEAALAHVNYKNIEIKGNQVRLKDPQAKIDLGGIAKGFIADEMRSFLNKKGITSGVISLGGNVLTLGKRQITLPIPLVSRNHFPKPVHHLAP